MSKINNHSERKHALLSASGATRWLSCSPSARLEEQFGVSTSSPYAKEGTLAHELAELMLRREVYDNMSDEQFNSSFEEILNKEEYNDEMLEEVPKYVNYCIESFNAAKSITSDAIICIEQKVDLTSYIPEGFGTCDCNIIADGTLEVIDLKYGKGVAVSATSNKQLMLYGLGALIYYEMSYDIQQVKLTISQPRLNNISTWTISAEDLREWANTELITKAKMAFNGEGEITVGDWCKFCTVKNVCRGLAKKNLEIAKYDFKEPDLLSEDEVSDILKRTDMLVEWANSINAYALAKAVDSGKVWPGFKLVEGTSRRKWVDEEKVSEVIFNRIPSLEENDVYKMKLKSITEIEKLVGKKKFAEALSDVIVKPQGKPSLVDVNDKRPALGIQQAVLDFN